MAPRDDVPASTDTMSALPPADDGLPTTVSELVMRGRPPGLSADGAGPFGPIVPGRLAVGPGRKLLCPRDHAGDLPAGGPAEVARPGRLVRWAEPDAEVYRRLYGLVGGSWNWVYRFRISDAESDAILADPRTEVVVLTVPDAGAEAIAGYFELYREDDGVTLQYFGLAEAFLGRGLGWPFLDAAIARAWAGSPACVRVETCTLDHPRALPLYEKAGFVKIGQRRQTIPRLTEDERRRWCGP